MNPTEFMNWWTTALMHRSLSGKDVRYVLTTLMPHIKTEPLMEECDSLNYNNGGPVEGLIIERKYPWLDRNHKDMHLQQLADFLKKNAAQEGDVTHVLNCKRKSNKPISKYASRFQCWKKKAKLQVSENENPFFISIFLNGLD